MDPIEAVYRSDHDRLWRSLVAFTGDRELASEAEAEVFSQAFGRRDELIDPAAWIWKSAFRIAAGLMAGRRNRTVDLGTDGIELDHSLVEFIDLLSDLSEQQRTVVVLRYAGGFRPVEIAELLDTSAETVRVQLHRAHAHLRERINPA